MKKLDIFQQKAIRIAFFVLLFWVLGMTEAISQIGAINALFSINEHGNRVYFSQGNLQYIGSAETPYWKFADHQWDCFGSSTNQNSSNQNVDRDLFPWGTSGINHGARVYQPWGIDTQDNCFYAYGSPNANLYDQTGQADWGYNAIANGGNQTGMWRTLTKDEWTYVFNNRYTWSGIRFAMARVNGMNGVILLPDDWNASYYPLNKTNQRSAGHSSNIITEEQWDTLEQHGAVFLPAAGYRHNVTVYEFGTFGAYWSSSYYDGENTTYSDSEDAYDIYMYGSLYVGSNYSRHYGESVRLVFPGPDGFYGINAVPSPPDFGIVEGMGNYPLGAVCSLTATANDGYLFVSWTENGDVVSNDSCYSFIVESDRGLVANFTKPDGVLITLRPGWNWISYLLEEEVAIEEALANLVPCDGDMIKSQNSFSVYDANTGGWSGDLRTMIPGEGYVYCRYGSLTRFTYPKL